MGVYNDTILFREFGRVGQRLTQEIENTLEEEGLQVEFTAIAFKEHRSGQFSAFITPDTHDGLKWPNLAGERYLAVRQSVAQKVAAITDGAYGLEDNHPGKASFNIIKTP